MAKTLVPKQKRHRDNTKLWEPNAASDIRASASALQDDQKEKFKMYHQAIYKDIEKETNNFLEFAEAKGAFNWQAGQYSHLDADFGHLARPEEKKMFE